MLNLDDFPDNLDTLPDEMIGSVIQYLSYAEIISLKQASKTMNDRLSTGNPHIFYNIDWTKELRDYFPEYQIIENRPLHKQFFKQYQHALDLMPHYSNKELAALSDKVKKDKGLMLAAVKNNYYALQYAHEDLQKSPEIVLAALRQYSPIFKKYVYTDFKPFWIALIDTRKLLLEINNDGYKHKIQRVLEACETRFLHNKIPFDTLAKILEKTNNLVRGEITANDYQEYANHIAMRHSRPMQLLGELMMAVAAIAIVLSLALVSISVVAILPAFAIVFGCSSLCLNDNLFVSKGDERDESPIDEMYALSTTPPALR